MVIINTIFVIFSIFIILFGLFSKESMYSDKINAIINKYYKIFILITFALTIFTTTYKFGKIPNGLNVDEAGMAYDAFCISEYGTDRYLNRFPVYLTNYGGGQSAMYAYLVAILIKIFGYNHIIIRIPIVIIRILSFFCCYQIVKNEKNKLKSIAFLFLLSIAPYFIMQSRWGLDCNLLVGFLTISICLLIQAIRTNSTKLLFISGISFGLTLYTYALSYIIVPIIIFLSCIYLLYIKKINIKKIILWGIPIFILALPLILCILVNKGIIKPIESIITIPLLHYYRGTEVSIKNIPDSFHIIKDMLTHDDIIYNSLPNYGTIYYCAIPFCIFGFICTLKKSIMSLRKKEFSIDTMFILWFFSVLICQLIIAGPNVNKANAIFVLLIYFVAAGIIRTCKKENKMLIPILAVFIISFGLFFNYYYHQYNKDQNGYYFFATDYLDAIEYSRSLKKNNVYIAPDLTGEEYIYVLLENSVSPYKYRKDNINTKFENVEINYNFYIPGTLDENSVYIIGNDEGKLSEFKQQNFNDKKIGNMAVLWKD